jgi:hypothetical protein
MSRQEIAEIVVLTAMNQASMYLPAIIKNPSSKKAQAIRREAVALVDVLNKLIDTIPEK